MATHTFTFMGTGAGCGVPAFFCTCPACEEARANPAFARGDCGVMIRGEKTLLLDTPPDTRHQLNRENVRAVDQLLYTHWHSDHIGGLLEFEYMVQLVTKAPLPIRASRETIASINQEFHYMTYALDMTPLDPWDTFEYDGVSYTALPVQHAAGTYGYLIQTDSTRMFYASDTGPLPDVTLEAIKDVDILALDATFWKKTWKTQAHLDITQTIATGLEIGAKKIYLTHLALHYCEPITVAELRAYLEDYDGRVEIAMDGMSFQI